MPNEILSTSAGPVLEITLNRPEHGNAATDAMATELIRLLQGAGDAAALVVLRGAGDDFCVGRASMGQAPPTNQEALERRRSSEVIFDCYAAVRRCAVPVVGVVQGRALGFGCAIAALCDITIATDKATFQIPEMNHNIFPTMVMSALVDRVPRKALLYMVYSRAVVDPVEAQRIGIVSRVVPTNVLEETVSKLVESLTGVPRLALQATKEYARSAFGMDAQGAVDYARNLHATINSSREMRRS